MKKKIISITLCAVMALSFAACTNSTPAKDNLKKQVSENNIEIPNPFVDCETVADATKIAGFDVFVPETIPTNYSQNIQAIKDEFVQIIYVDGENQITFRQGKGSEDISGDNKEYKEVNTVTIGSLQVTTKGDDAKINVATWTNGEYSYAILADSLDNKEVNDMISSIKSEAVVGGDDVQIPSPFIGCDTMDDAGKIAGFTVTLPEKMPKSYLQKFIQAVENDMIQVIYTNDEQNIVIRKAKGSEDVSGDFNEYAESNTLTVGNLVVSTKGNSGKVSVATWIDGEFTYSITHNLDETGFDAAVISDMVNGIR